MSIGRPNIPTGFDKFLLYLAVAVSMLLRLFGLGRQSVWGDEALTLQLYSAGSGIGEVLSRIWSHGFHPPVYFAVVHYWCRLGDSEFMLRFPSVVFGVAAIPVMFLVARRLYGSAAAVISAFVLALSPFHIWYSQEARMYSLQVLLALGSTFFFLRAWQHRRPADFTLYAVITILGLFTHIGTLLLVAAQGVFVLAGVIRDWRRHLLWIGVQSLVVISFAPWLYRFAASRESSSSGGVGFERETSLLHLGYGLYTFNVGYSLGPSVSALHWLSPGDAVMRHLPIIAISALVFGTLVMLGLVHAYKENRIGFWFLLSHLLVPAALVGAASLLPGIPLNPRYLMVAAIPYWIVLSLGIRLCGRSRIAPALPAAAAVLIGISLHNYYYQPEYAKQDMRSAVALVSEKAEPGDVIIISSIELGGPFIYYFKRDDIPYVGYPPTPGLVNPDKLESDMRKILRNKTRVWLILGRTWSSDPQGLILWQMKRHYRLIESRRYPGVLVQCFHCG